MLIRMFNEPYASRRQTHCETRDRNIRDCTYLLTFLNDAVPNQVTATREILESVSNDFLNRLLRPALRGKAQLMISPWDIVTEEIILTR